MQSTAANISNRETVNIGRCPTLPQEILDHIVSFVDDTATLLACCLSSRTLLNMGTKMVFRNLYVSTKTHTEITQELQRSPDKAAAVKQLTLSARTPSNSAHRRQSIDIAHAATVLSYLNNVRHITIDTQTWIRHFPVVMPFQDCGAARSVTRLDLRDICVEVLCSILNLLSAFPSLRHLTMHGVYWQMWREITGRYEHPKLLSLDVQAVSPAIIPHLIDQEAVQQLEVLALAGSADVLNWWSLFKDDVVYDKLQHITIHDYPSHHSSALTALPNCPSMRSLTLNGLLVRTRNSRQFKHAPYICHFLDKVVSTCVEELVFEFIHVTWPLMTGFAPSQWIPYFYEERFAKLTRVVYVFRGVSLTNAKAEIVAHVWDAHESWDRREIIEVVVEDTRPR